MENEYTSNNEQSIISIQNFSFAFNKNREILKKINLQIKKGEWIGICGPSGEGKTTLIRLINGSLFSDEKICYSGSIKVMGKNVKEFDNLNRTIATVYQNPDNQIIFTNVVDEIVFGMENFNSSKGKMEERVQQVMNRLNIKHLCDRNPNYLSGGEKQLVVLASVLCLDIAVLVLDEAFSYVDLDRKNLILAYLKELNQQGVTIIMIDHMIEHFKMVDRIYTLNNGIILEGA